MIVNLVLIGLFRFFIPRFFMEQLMELESVTIVQEFQTFELYDRAWILQAIVLLDYLDGVPVGRSVCFPGRQGNRTRKIIYVEMF